MKEKGYKIATLGMVIILVIEIIFFFVVKTRVKNFSTIIHRSIKENEEISHLVSKIIRIRERNKSLPFHIEKLNARNLIAFIEKTSRGSSVKIESITPTFTIIDPKENVKQLDIEIKIGENTLKNIVNFMYIVDSSALGLKIKGINIFRKNKFLWKGNITVSTFLRE